MSRSLAHDKNLIIIWIFIPRVEWIIPHKFWRATKNCYMTHEMSLYICGVPQSIRVVLYKVNRLNAKNDSNNRIAFWYVTGYGMHIIFSSFYIYSFLLLLFPVLTMSSLLFVLYLHILTFNMRAPTHTNTQTIWRTTTQNGKNKQWK